MHRFDALQILSLFHTERTADLIKEVLEKTAHDGKGGADCETPSKQIPISALQMDGVDSSGNRRGSEHGGHH